VVAVVATGIETGPGLDLGDSVGSIVILGLLGDFP